MKLLLGDDNSTQALERGMTRFLKPFLLVFAALAALLLTLTRKAPDGVPLSSHAAVRSPSDPLQQYDLQSLRTFTIVLGRVKENYVEPERIAPREMLREALDAVEKEVAEVLVKESDDKKRITVRVQDAERTFDVYDVDSPWTLSSRMKSVMRFIQPQLLPSTEIRDVEYAAVNGMLSTLDPHSVLLKPEFYDEMKLSTRGEFGGLGIVIAMLRGVLTVMNPMKGTPAEVAGLKACDQILKIGEESTQNMTINQAVSRLRGMPGSKVEITVLRGGWKSPVRKILTRAVIKVPSVTSRMLSHQVGYLKLNSFQGNSFDDVKNQIAAMKQKQMKGLILDLRNDPGGLLDQAIKISDYFIESGTLVTTIGNAGKIREEKRAQVDGTEERYPVAVLVNSASASASEIVAGALKHLDRAVVIGNRTFGKGSVQVLYDNDDGSALKLTIAQYLTPGDISIQSVGITPDVVTEPVLVRSDRIRLDPEERYPREQDLDKHLVSRNVRTNEKSSQTVRYLVESSRGGEPTDEDSEEDEEDAFGEDADPTSGSLCLFPDRQCKPMEEDKFVEDFQIKFAKELLAQTSSWRRSQVMAGSKDYFSKAQGAQDVKVADELKKIGVDWSAPAAPVAKGQSGKLHVSVATEPKGGVAKACERMKFTVTVRNDGPAPVYRLRAKTESTNRLYEKRELVFGKLMPGDSRSWSVPVEVRDAPTRVDEVSLNFEDAASSKYVPYTFQLNTQGVNRPMFAYSYQLVDDHVGESAGGTKDDEDQKGGNGDGRVQVGEGFRLYVNVKNNGKGKALRTVATLRSLAEVGIVVKKGRFELGQMMPGEMRSVSFTCDVLPNFDRSNFKVELRVYDEGLGEQVTDKLEFPIAGAMTPSISKALGTVTVKAKSADLRAWADDKAPSIGTATAGTVFKSLQKGAGWYRVLVSADRPAFINASTVTTGGTLVANAAGFRPNWQVTPPRLLLRVPTYATSNASVRIEGTATDETRVSDLFIFVRNLDAKIERKVYYQSASKGSASTKLDFASDVPLWEGANYVTVYARENTDVQSNETVVIFRKPSGQPGKRIETVSLTH